MVKITGFDQLTRQVDELKKAFHALDGQFATVSLDPSRPESVEEAIRVMEAAIDRKVAPYRNNPMVANIVPQLKEKYRTAIRERAARAQSNEN